MKDPIITASVAGHPCAQEIPPAGEEQFRLLVESVTDYAIFLLDPEGHIASWNAGAQRIKGYRADEIIGRHFCCFYPEEEVARGKPARQLQRAASEGRLEDEGWRLRKGGSRFFADVVITALRDGAGTLRGFAKVTRDVTDKRQAQEAQRGYTERLLGLLAIEQAIRAAGSPEEIAHAALGALSHQLPRCRASVTVFDGEAEEARVLAAVGADEALWSPGARLPREAAACGGMEALARGQHLLVEDLRALPWLAPGLRALAAGGLRSALSVPLRGQQALLGALSLAAEGPAAFGEEEVQLAREVADRLAVALEHARLAEQVREGHEQLRVLSRRLIEAQEAERRHLARELHDQVGQALTAVKINMQAAHRLSEQVTEVCARFPLEGGSS